jgi:hypothetical protein
VIDLDFSKYDELRDYLFDVLITLWSFGLWTNCGLTIYTNILQRARRDKSR